MAYKWQKILPSVQKEYGGRVNVKNNCRIGQLGRPLTCSVFHHLLRQFQGILCFLDNFDQRLAQRKSEFCLLEGWAGSKAI